MANKKNRRKKKKKRIGMGLVLIEWILGIGIVIAILIGACYYFCPLKEVIVEGTDLYSDSEIQNYILDDKYCSNTIYAFLKNKLFPKSDAEFIESFDVSINNKNSITITANEKTILGYLTNDDLTYIYFDYDGTINEISETYVDGYMKVEGVVCEDAQLGDTLSIGEAQAGYLSALIKLLQKESLLPNVISYDDYNHITLLYDNYNISLGSNEYLEEKITRITYILPQIEGMSGTLHLENYSPNSTDIVFEKEVVTE